LSVQFIYPFIDTEEKKCKTVRSEGDIERRKDQQKHCFLILRNDMAVLVAGWERTNI
jgi:hypothetical protein